MLSESGTPSDHPTTPVVIRDFAPGDEDAFRRLNEEWITRYFRIEPKDISILSHPQQSILDPGGHILMAVLNGQAIGCCALLPLAPGEYELAKMAVTASAQGAGVGRLVLQSAIDKARSIGATRLFLETNSTLTSAIHLYESLGFSHVPAARLTPSPYARVDVCMELSLNP